MNINEVDQMVLFLVNRTQTGNTTPARRNLAYQLANISLYKRYAGIPEEYAPGSPISKMSFSITGDIENVARLFKKPATLYIDPATGISTNLPADFQDVSTMNYSFQKDGKAQTVPVNICNDVEFQEAQTSYIVPADIENPACVFRGTQIEFLPKTLVNAQMIYFRMPVKPVWGYTLVSNRPVYDESTSVDPEWPDHVINDFIMRALQFMGIEMQRNTLVQLMEQFKQQGN